MKTRSAVLAVALVAAAIALPATSSVAFGGASTAGSVNTPEPIMQPTVRAQQDQKPRGLGAGELMGLRLRTGPPNARRLPHPPTGRSAAGESKVYGIAS